MGIFQRGEEEIRRKIPPRKATSRPRSGRKDSEYVSVDFKDFGAQISIEVPATAL